MNIYIHTFGCKLNINESENIKSSLASLSYNFTQIEQAECFIINTCTVTKQSDDKVEKYLLKIKTEFNISNNYPIFLIGCYVSKESYVNDDKNVIIITNKDKDNAATIIDEYLQKHYNNIAPACENTEEIDDTSKYNQECFNKNASDNNDDNSDDKSRYFLKIQDGCNVFCTYCIIAFVRGQARSLNPLVIIENIQKAKNLGYKEIVFTGINIASYMYEGIDFESLIKQHILPIVEESTIRLRISSIEPFLFTDKIISLFEHPNICPHIHIPLQSASDNVLALMNRRYNKSDYKTIINKIRSLKKEILITTDVMVGFAGESESDFQETLELAKEVKFFKMHIFRYSKREGTKAYHYENQVGYRTKVKRAKLLNEINTQMHKYYLDEYIKKNLEVEIIIEKKINSNEYFGTTGQYLKAKIIDAQESLDKKMLISGKCIASENNILIVKYEKIL